MSAPVPEYLRPLADRARTGDRPLPGPQAPDDRTRPVRDAAARAPEPSADTHGRPVRDSAVLFLFTGSGPDDAQLVVEERGARMRSQPGQFALPGGGAEPGDRSRVATALREAHEEIGLDPSDVQVLGSFRPVPMPWRRQRVSPVLAWSQAVPEVRVADPREVERVEWLPLLGPDSLTDSTCRFEGRLDGRAVGPVFHLSRGRFVWGFTASLIAGALELLAGGVDGVTRAGVPWDRDGRSRFPVVEIPPERRRDGPIR